MQHSDGGALETGASPRRIPGSVYAPSPPTAVGGVNDLCERPHPPLWVGLAREMTYGTNQSTRSRRRENRRFARCHQQGLAAARPRVPGEAARAIHGGISSRATSEETV